MTDSAISHFRTNVGAHSAWWRAEGGRIEVTHLTDRELPIDAERLGEHGAIRTSCHSVLFADPPTLAQAHFLLPRYHALWCAVSERFRRHTREPADEVGISVADGRPGPHPS